MYVKNSAGTFINSSASTTQVVVEHPGGQRETVNLRPGESLDLKKGRYAGSVVYEQIQYFKSSKDILKNAAIFDIETLGKGTGSIHEMALYRVDEKALDIAVLKPEMVSRIDEKAESMQMRRSGMLQFRNITEILKQGGTDVSKLTYRDYAMLSFLKDESILSGVLDHNRNIMHAPGSLEERALFSLWNASIQPDLNTRQRIIGEDIKAISSAMQNLKIDPNTTLLEAFEKKENYLARYLPGTKANIEFIKQHPEIASVLEYLSDNAKNLTEADIEDVLLKSFPNHQAEVKELKTNIIKDITGDPRVSSSEAFEQIASKMKGKVIFIANAAFESKQIGSYLDAKVNEELIQKFGETEQERAQKISAILQSKSMPVNDVNIKKEMQAQSDAIKRKHNPFFRAGIASSLQTGENFYTTGIEYNKARAQAYKSGDFSNLMQSFLENTKAGDVRDIQDVIRSHQAMLGKMKVMDYKKPLAMSMEVQARLYNMLSIFNKPDFDVTDKDTQIKMREAIGSFKETHLSYGDVAISERVALTESVEQAEALNTYMRMSGKERAVIRGSGVSKSSGLFKSVFYGKLMEQMQGHGVFEALFRQRAGTLLELLGTTGEAFKVATPEEGQIKIAKKQQKRVVQVMDKFGQPMEQEVIEEIATARPSVKRLTNYLEVKDLLLNTKDYPNIDTARIVQDIENNLIKQNVLEVKGPNYVDFTTDAMIKGTKENLSLLEFAAGQQQAYHGQIKGMEIMAKKMNIPHMISKTNMFLKGYEFGGVRAKVPNLANLETTTRAQKMGSFSNLVNYQLAGKNLDPDAASKVVDDTMKSFKKHLADETVLGKAFSNMTLKHFGMYALGAAAIHGANAINDYVEGTGPSSVLVPDYDTWYKKQSEFFGNENSFLKSLSEKTNIEGMGESGLGAMMRKMNTDFGSPYQGPEYSASVLDNVRLTNARQRYLSKAFTKSNFSNEGNINLILKKYMKNLGGAGIVNYDPQTKEFFSDMVPVSQEEVPFLKSSNFMEINLSKGYQLSVEDADTLTVQRSGLGSSLEQFMGSRPKFSFRLAGIDAPETAHDDRAAQPYAEEAKIALQNMIKAGKDVKMYVNPAESTYGRQVGLLYVDGKNVNLDLIRKGAVAHLPYKSKSGEQLWDDESFGKAAIQASQGNKGIYSTGYFKAYADFKNQTGESVTFNTLANYDKVARNANLMTLTSIMEGAQKRGQYDVYAQEQMMLLKQKMSDQKYKKGDDFFNALDDDYISNEFRQLTNFSQNYNPNSYKKFDQEVKADLLNLMKTRNSKINYEKMNHSNLKELDSHLANSSMSSGAIRNNKSAFSNMNMMRYYGASPQNIKKRKDDIAYLTQVTLQESMEMSPSRYQRM